MPGRHLNDHERKLGGFWQSPPSNFRKPLLKQIKISGGTGLRGIKGLIVPFNYPITAICGKNGVGKTTALALSALAFHSPVSWYVYRGQLHSNRSLGERDYYKFEDFFFRGQGDEHVRNVEISWTYFQDGREVPKLFKKNGDRWLRNDRRPEREVDYIPINRIIPASEMRPLRSVFRIPVTPGEVRTLNPRMRQCLSAVLGREYTDARVQKKRRWSLHHCRSTAAYSGFNMGAGESSLIALLERIQNIPVGGLLVIEEIELGLHPEAQKNFAQELVKICDEKKLQVICSTHSETFVDALPQQARLLLRRQGTSHVAVSAPTTRYALFEITGEVQPELLIYCEDAVSAVLIQESLDGETRGRVKIMPIGSHTALAQQAVSHERAGLAIRSLTIFDGDVSETIIKREIKSASEKHDYKPRYISLARSGMTPEQWAVEQLKIPDYARALSQQMGFEFDKVVEFVEKLKVEMDAHNIVYRLHKLTGFDPADCLRRMATALTPRHPQFDHVRSKVQELLDGSR